MRSQHRLTLADWGSLMLLSVLWGGSFFFSKVAVQALPPLTLVLARVSIAAAALWIFLRVRGIAVPRTSAAWLAFAGMGALNNLIPFTLLVWSQTVISSGLASILNATTPLFSIVAAHVLTEDDQISTDKIAGICLGLAGVAVLVGPAVSTGASSLPAILACLGAALSYGLASVFGRRFKRLGIEPALGAFGQLTASATMMFPLALCLDTPWRLPLPGGPVLASVLALALVSTALAYIIFFRLLSMTGATNVSLVTLLVPVSAVLLGTLVLGERLSGSQLGGMALVAAGLLVIDGRARIWARSVQTRCRPPSDPTTLPS